MIVRLPRETVEPEGTPPITDEYRAYNTTKTHCDHAAINHGVACADGEMHTTTIEGFRAL